MLSGGLFNLETQVLEFWKSLLNYVAEQLNFSLEFSFSPSRVHPQPLFSLHPGRPDDKFSPIIGEVTSGLRHYRGRWLTLLSLSSYLSDGCSKCQGARMVEPQGRRIMGPLVIIRRQAA